MKRHRPRPALLRSIVILCFGSITTYSTHAQTDTEDLNNTCDPALFDTIALDQPNTAALHVNADVDFFRVEVPSGGVLQATVSSTAPGASFNVEIRDGSCTTVANATGLPGQDGQVNAVVCPGVWFVGVTRATGTAPIAYVLTATISGSGECGGECDNTMATAAPLTALDTVLQARLWGSNAAIAAGTPFPISEDQDFFHLHTDTCGGALSIHVSDIPELVTLRVSCYAGTPEAPVHVWTFQREGCISGDLMGTWLLEADTDYWLRFHDESTEQENCNSAYNMSPDCFTVALAFSSGCGGCDGGEVNNTPATAAPLPLNTMFTTRLWGYNEQIAADSVWGRSQDQDVFAIATDADSGVLHITVTDIPEGITLRAGLYAGEPFTEEHIGTFQRPACFSGDLTGAWAVEAGTAYFLRLYDETSEDSLCGGLYNMDPGCFTVALSFAPGDCLGMLEVTAAEGPGPGEATATVNGGIAPYAWAWSNGDTTQTAHDLLPGTYSVTVTDVAGCTGTAEVVVIGTAMDEFGQGAIVVWPNPTNGEIRVRSAPDASLQWITMCDASGRTVATFPRAGVNNTITLDLGGRDVGLYLLRMHLADGSTVVRRVVKQ